MTYTICSAVWLFMGLIGAEMARRDDTRSYGSVGRDFVPFYLYCVFIGPLAIAAELIHRRWGK